MNSVDAGVSLVLEPLGFFDVSDAARDYVHRNVPIELRGEHLCNFSLVQVRVIDQNIHKSSLNHPNFAVFLPADKRLVPLRKLTPLPCLSHPASSQHFPARIALKFPLFLWILYRFEFANIDVKSGVRKVVLAG